MGGNSISGNRIHGMDEMHTLVVSAISALETARLSEEAQYLHSHVLARSPETLIETVMVEPNVFQWSFKPFVELLLHEIREVALATDLSSEARRARVRWAFDAAGI
jgi:hypothetical protein